MSIFDFPRLHVRGLMSVNVGTANNDDYADMTVKATYDEETGDPVMAPFKKLPVRLADTDRVQPDSFGQSDAGFNKWAASELEVNESKNPVIPGEWNFFGSMGIDMQFSFPASSGKTGTSYVTVASAQTDATTVYKTVDELTGVTNGESIKPMMGARLSYQKRTDYQHSSAMMIDCSQEGSSQSTMVIADNLMLSTPEDEILMSREIDPNTGNYSGGGQPSMAHTWWLNFQRNANFPGPGGAAGTFQHVVKFEAGLNYTALKTFFEQHRPASETRPIAGVVYRWTLFRCSSALRNDNEGLMELYKKGGTNPAVGTLVGTLAPWYEGDATEPLAMGRLLQPYSTAGFDPDKGGEGPGTFKLPDGAIANGAYFRLAPVIANYKHGILSLDISNTFPEQYANNPNTDFDAYHDDTIVSGTNNPKYDLKTLTLVMNVGGTSTTLGTLSFDSSGTVSYGTETFYTQGGMVDLVVDISEDDLTNGELQLLDSEQQPMLYEPELMIASVEGTSYTEQALPGESVTTNEYNYAGQKSTISLTIYKKGVPITEAEYQTMVAAGKGLEINTWVLNPLQLQGTVNINPIATVPVNSLTFTLDTNVTNAGTQISAVMRKGVSALYGGPITQQTAIDLMVYPVIYVRILPNEDFSQFYEDPTADELVGNETLHFGVIYERIFRNYFLLYPVMSQMVPMNDPQEWANPNMAKKLLERISNNNWLSYQYMPRTRDLSKTRMGLLTAFCNAIIKYPSRFVS